MVGLRDRGRGRIDDGHRSSRQVPRRRETLTRCHRSQPRAGVKTADATRLSLSQARRLAIRAQVLDGSAHEVLGTVQRLGFLQLDPTSQVAPSHLLVLWSRLGAYDRADLDRLLWRARRLFEWRAFIQPTEDYPLVKRAMLRFPGDAGAWQRRVAEWLKENESFRRYILREIRTRGPLRSTDFEDRSVRPWPSSGWTAGRNVTQMLGFMGTRGEIMVTRREGGERVWDLPERVLPAAVLRLRPASERTIGLRRLRSLGLTRRSPAYRGIGERVRVDGVPGEWVADMDALEHVDEPLPRRMTFLSPFDRLIYDRERAVDLFAFRYRTDIYTPKAKRQYGSYAMPILLGENLVGRMDARYDAKGHVLRVRGVHREPGARIPQADLRETLRSLQGFLAAVRIAQP